MPDTDSKPALLDRAIKAQLWPLLKEHGFSRFTARNAWRFHADRIDVVHVQAFSVADAGYTRRGLDSFSVNLGCHLRYIPSHAGAIRERNGLPLPEESQCLLRRRILDTRRPSFLAWLAAPRRPRTVWPVGGGAADLEHSMTMVGKGLLDQGLPWFAGFADPREALRIFLDEAEDMERLWGFGNRSSPLRSYCIGFTALAAGAHALAAEHLERALGMPSYNGDARVRAALGVARGKLAGVGGGRLPHA